MMDFFVLDDVLDKMVRKLFWIRQGQQNFADSQIISVEFLRKSEKMQWPLEGFKNAYTMIHLHVEIYAHDCVECT